MYLRRAQVDPGTLGINLFLIIGGLLCLSGAALVLTAVWIGLKVWLFHRRQRLARQEYLRKTRRADGKMYPPVYGGICDQCGRISKTIHHLKSGEKLCRTCYERFWRQAEAWAAESNPTGGTASDPAELTPARHA